MKYLLQPLDQQYLCILFLKNSIERIMSVYYVYFNLHGSSLISFEMIIMLHFLQKKQYNLDNTLFKKWPDYMHNKKWHTFNEQKLFISQLSIDKQKDIKKIIGKELHVLSILFATVYPYN